MKPGNSPGGRATRTSNGIRHVAPGGAVTALLVDAKEASRLLSVSPRKLWAMTFEEEPGLPYIRFGRLIRYSVEDLRNWIAAQRKGGDA